MVKDIGLNVKAPQTECTDPNCPFHGHLAVPLFQAALAVSKIPTGTVGHPGAEGSTQAFAVQGGISTGAA